MTSTEGEEEPERQKGVELGGSDLDNAKVDDMAQALEKLECEKRGVLESIRVLRVRLADEKVLEGRLLVNAVTCCGSCRCIQTVEKKLSPCEKRIVFGGLEHAKTFIFLGSLL